MNYDKDFIDNSFDNLAFFLRLWKKFKNPSWKDTRENMAKSTDNQLSYTLHDSYFASYLFEFYNPICTLEYLENHLGDLRPSGKTYIEYIIRICKNEREDIAYYVEDMCDYLGFDLNSANYLERFLPFSEYSCTKFLKRCLQNISSADFIRQVSFLIIADIKENNTDYEELKKRFDTLLGVLKKQERFPFSLKEVIFKIRNQIEDWLKRLKLDYAKDLNLSSTPLVDGLFVISWTYVTFIRGYVLVYHPLHPNDKPFKIEDKRSISALNNIISHYAARLPRLVVKAENGYITDIYNYIDIDSGIVFLLEKYNRENKTILSKEERSPRDFDDKELREYIHQLKSIYLDWLCDNQLEEYKIYCIREVRANYHSVEEDEEAFLFIINDTESYVTVVYENIKEFRSSLVFKFDKVNLEEDIQEVHEFFSSNQVNKRELIVKKQAKEHFFTENKNTRILHNDFNQWKNEVIRFSQNKAE